MRQRPTAALLEESDPFSGWTSLDYTLQEASYLINQELCGACNNPVWLCHSTDNTIDFEAVISTCYAKADLEDLEENPGTAKLGRGEYRHMKAVGIENEDGSFDPLPTRREILTKGK